MSENTKQNPIKGIVCGLVAGGVASAGMDLYWGLVHNAPGARPEQKPKGGDRNQVKDEPSTQIIADKVSKALTGHQVPQQNKAEAGVAVHYAFGAFWGGAYGAVAARKPEWGLLAGLLYGTAIWLFLDEIGLRALGIAPNPRKVPVSQHLEALGAHFVYGSATALFTRLLLRLLSRS